MMPATNPSAWPGNNASIAASNGPTPPGLPEAMPTPNAIKNTGHSTQNASASGSTSHSASASAVKSTVSQPRKRPSTKRLGRRSPDQPSTATTASASAICDQH